MGVVSRQWFSLSWQIGNRKHHPFTNDPIHDYPIISHSKLELSIVKIQEGVHGWIPTIHHEDWECNHSTTQTQHTQYGNFHHQTWDSMNGFNSERKNAEQYSGSRDVNRSRLQVVIPYGLRAAYKPVPDQLLAARKKCHLYNYTWLTSMIFAGKHDGNTKPTRVLQHFPSTLWTKGESI